VKNHLFLLNLYERKLFIDVLIILIKYNLLEKNYGFMN